ncbi:DNA gyrase subunit B [Plasmodium brasilianum]|uniref:DNA topoisomerase 2 n=2 Tax=Plasmodium (Plasmodium) TaxID=418103 RepID=A0A1A8WE70_PLAMA|nr:DNA gyrase subunit B, putative [Plasmodium malariae]KAI4835101.1 DNA gyrase subunit B [Plasmodium brasilianum]SBS91260.1 DNA gyrase subunit B, putative [Plasmodium malariae]SCP03677.1 DNA gyrase subunit B, putative [Plasmodium malariae]
MNIEFIKSFAILIFLVKDFLLHTEGKAQSSRGSKYLRWWNFCKKKLNKEEESDPSFEYDVRFSKRKLAKKRIDCFLKNYKRFDNLKGRVLLKYNNNRNFRCMNYDAKDIVILEGLEAVRKRPGMYIGNTDTKGLHQLLFEIIDNSVDEYNNFECNEIKLVIHNDESVTIEDNGRGIPCDIHEKTKKSALETVLTVLHSGAKFFDDDSEMQEGEAHRKKTDADSEGGENKNILIHERLKANVTNKGKTNNSDGSNKAEEKKGKIVTKENLQKYKYSSGLHGVGLSVANALSSFMKVKVFRNNKMYSIELEKGKVKKELSVCNCPINKRGTQIHYKPDSTIFKNTIKHNSELIKNRIHQLAYLNDKLTFYFYDERSANEAASVPLKGIKSNDGLNDKKKDNACDPKDETCETNNENRNMLNGSRSYDNTCGGIKPTHEEPIGDYNKLNFYNYEIIKHERGLNEYIENLTKSKTNLFKDSNKVISITCFQKNIYIDLRMKWSINQYNENIISFVNNVNTIDGGTHVDALKYAISKSVNFNIKKNEATKNFVNIPGEYIREGLTAILSIKMINPEFEGQTKSKLGSYCLKSVLENIIFEKLSEIFDFEPNLLNTIYMKALQAKISDEEAKAARDMIRSKNSQHYSTVLPGKLVDCISDDISRNEIFIVEGDSAAGSAKQARNREIQAILPLKGKILNVEKIKNNKRIFENTELKSLITAIGLSVNCHINKSTRASTNILNKGKKDIKKKYDLRSGRNDNILSSSSRSSSILNKKKNTLFDSPLRYGKIIIMTDADVDGEHIRILLLTFLYRFQKEIIENGNVYVACPPLYKITYNKFFDDSIKQIVTKQFNITAKNSRYIIHTYSDEELSALLALLDKDKASASFEKKNRATTTSSSTSITTTTVSSTFENATSSIEKEMDDNYNHTPLFSCKQMDEEKNANDIPLLGHNSGNINESNTDALVNNKTLFTFSKKYEIQRFKGLGEMMADQLWNTTMNPRVRKLIRVTVNDAIKANNMINSLMGEDSKLRKDFILEYSNSVSV